MRDSSCFFCNIADELMIAEDELCFAMRDDFPVSEGHTLIISKRQVADCFDLTDEEIMAMQTMMRELKVKLDEDLSPDGYNVGINVNEAAGQAVFHVHMHLAP